MKCIIVDDEEMSRIVLEYLCNRINELQVVAVCDSAMTAMDILRKRKVDLMFLDIQMPHITGMDILRQAEDLPQVILTTGRKDYALEAFELEVTDFLVKPITFPRLEKAVNRARRLAEKE